jgi:hypothetical protein
MITTTADAGSVTVTGQPQARQLRRSGHDKMLAGVAGQDGPNPEKRARTRSSAPLVRGDVAVNTQLILGRR